MIRNILYVRSNIVSRYNKFFGKKQKSKKQTGAMTKTRYFQP